MIRGSARTVASFRTADPIWMTKVAATTALTTATSVSLAPSIQPRSSPFTRKSPRLHARQVQTAWPASGRKRDITAIDQKPAGAGSGRFDRASVVDQPVKGRIMISTRRFWALPSAVALEAIGWLSPRPSTYIRAGRTPRSIR